MPRTIPILTPADVLRKKAAHWLKYTGSYRALAERHDAKWLEDVDLCVEEYNRILDQIRVMADSGSEEARKALSWLPADPVNPQGVLLP